MSSIIPTIAKIRMTVLPHDFALSSAYNIKPLIAATIPKIIATMLDGRMKLTSVRNGIAEKKNIIRIDAAKPIP